MKTAATRMQGVMLIEALIAILIFSIGILAIVGMQGVAIKTVTQSKYRSEAAFLANEVLSQMWADTGNLASYDLPAGAPCPPGWPTGKHESMRDCQGRPIRTWRRRSRSRALPRKAPTCAS